MLGHPACVTHVRPTDTASSSSQSMSSQISCRLSPGGHSGLVRKPPRRIPRRVCAWVVALCLPGWWEVGWSRGNVPQYRGDCAIRSSPTRDVNTSPVPSNHSPIISPVFPVSNPHPSLPYRPMEIGFQSPEVSMGFSGEWHFLQAVRANPPLCGRGGAAPRPTEYAAVVSRLKRVAVGPPPRIFTCLCLAFSPPLALESMRLRHAPRGGPIGVVGDSGVPVT